MNKRLKQELDNIEIPEEFEQRSRDGINKAYFEINPKKRIPKLLITCAVCLFITVGAWMTPPVKASIQNAFNLLLAEKFENMNSGKKITKEKVLVGVEENSLGQKVTTYISVDSNGNLNERTENDNGDFSVSNGEIVASYTKKDNTFVIEYNNSEEAPIEKEIFSNLPKESIEFLGTKKLLEIDAEVYKVDLQEEGMRELWFDKDTDILVREIQIINGESTEENKLLSLKTIEKKTVPDLFKIEPPNGAYIIDHTKK